MSQRLSDYSARHRFGGPRAVGADRQLYRHKSEDHRKFFSSRPLPARPQAGRLWTSKARASRVALECHSGVSPPSPSLSRALHSFWPPRRPNQPQLWTSPSRTRMARCRVCPPPSPSVLEQEGPRPLTPVEVTETAS